VSRAKSTPKTNTFEGMGRFGNLTGLVCRIILLALTLLVTGAIAEKNVLLVIVDDLTTDIGVYGSEDVQTPHLDAFSETSVRFNKAYAQIAKCGPSRVSLLTSRGPGSAHYFYHRNGFRETKTVRKATTIIDHFKNRGYLTIGTSKIFHFKRTNERQFDQYNWEAVHTSSSTCFDGSPLICDARTENVCTDKRSIDFAIAKLREVAEKDANQKWLMAVGIRRPHLSWEVPQGFVRGKKTPKASLPRNSALGKGAPAIADRGLCGPIAKSKEIRAFGSEYATTSVLERKLTRKLRDGYFRTVEWVDELIGRLLTELEDLSLDKNTVVVITSDHGFNLGENGQWCKMSLFEKALRVPLWIKHPDHLGGMVDNEHPVELLSLFPTIADLAGVPLSPEELVDGEIEGRSFANLISSGFKSPEVTLREAPTLDGYDFSFPGGNTVAFSVLQRCDELGCERVLPKNFDAMGYSLRTKRFRYTEWRKWNVDGEIGDFINEDGLIARELYDYDLKGELENLAAVNVNDENVKELIEEFSGYLRARFVKCDQSVDGKSIRRDSMCTDQGEHCIFNRRRCQTKTLCFESKRAKRRCQENEFCKWHGWKKCFLK